jgi:hypothetical protein
MNIMANAARQELKGYIDFIPERSFEVVRNLLSYLAETDPVFNGPLVIEPADAEEITLIKEGMKEYEKNPSTFTPWKTVKKEMGLTKPDYTIEQASPEEGAMVEERVKEYHENPNSLFPGGKYAETNQKP